MANEHVENAAAAPPSPGARSGRVPLSVLIPVKNEAGNLPDCLASVAFASEVVVVDSESTDGTQAIAEAAGARVVQFAFNGRFPKKKNWALENVDWANEWVLVLDADERITPELAAEIERELAAAPPARSGFYVNRRFMFMGGWLRHCGYYPSWNLRLFRHRAGRYERLDVSGDTRSGDNEVHEHVIVEGGESDGRVAYLQNDMLHYAYPSIDVFIEKHNRYSNWEARVARDLHNPGDGEQRLRPTPFGNALQRKRWIKRLARLLPFRPTCRFFYHFVVRAGFLDGYRGFVFCRLLAWYEMVSIAKAAEIATAEKT